VTFLSDLEGDWDKLVDVASRSAALELDDDGRLRVKDGFALVYGGDTVDRGPGSRRLLATLCECFDRENARTPDTVTLLVGNRDANKLRLPFELDGFAAADRPAELQRILSKTMGAAQAFEWRRRELAASGTPSPSDAAIVESLLDDVRPGGALFEYLRRARLAFAHGPALFVHGAVGPDSFGYVPGRSERLDDTDRWLEGLDEFYRGELARYERGERPEGLLRYQAPAPETPGKNTKSVVYGRYNDDSGNPELPPVDFRRKLALEGFRWVVSGHTPGGDTPVPLVSPESVTFVMADMSVARMPGELLVARTEAVCSAGVVSASDEAHVFTMQLWADETPCPVGRRHADGWVARGTLEDARWWVGRVSLPGYRVEQQALPIDAGNDGWEFAEPEGTR
jgi:hypothetical protein